MFLCGFFFSVSHSSCPSLWFIPLIYLQRGIIPPLCLFFANLNIKCLAIFKRFPNPGLCYFSLFMPFFWKVRIRILPIRKTAMTNTSFDLSSVTPAFSYHLLPRHQYIRYLYLHLSSWDCSQLALIQTQSLSRLRYSIDCTSKVRYNKASHAPI